MYTYRRPDLFRELWDSLGDSLNHMKLIAVSPELMPFRWFSLFHVIFLCFNLFASGFHLIFVQQHDTFNLREDHPHLLLWVKTFISHFLGPVHYLHPRLTLYCSIFYSLDSIFIEFGLLNKLMKIIWGASFKFTMGNLYFYNSMYWLETGNRLLSFMSLTFVNSPLYDPWLVEVKYLCRYMRNNRLGGQEGSSTMLALHFHKMYWWVNER